MNQVMNAGHVVGGLTGLFLGWGIGPTLVAVPADSGDANSPKAMQSKAAQKVSSSRDEAADPSVRLRRKSDPMSGIRQVSISASLLAGLAGIVATTVAQRVGHIPVPHGLGL